jgi:OFA family oxalate/formate antiporter-like MFS transporter
MSQAVKRQVDDDRMGGATRWWQLALGVLCMSMIANLQYGWTLFVNPIEDKHHWGLPAIQVAFSVFVLIETWLVPLEGYIVDRFGPKLVGVASGVLVATAWVINAKANTLAMLYLGAVVGGIGGGGVYGACVGNALKWFPDRRGLAAGITAMGYGAGSALTVYPIANMIQSQGYEAAFLKFGIAQGLVVFLVAWLLRAPDDSMRFPPAKKKLAAKQEVGPIEMLKSPAFWVMFVMFMLTATGGLLITAQLKPIAKDFALDKSKAILVGITVATLPFALSVTRILNGVSRPFFGWMSDQIGRENAMFVAFALEAVAFVLFGMLGKNPVGFILLACFIFFCYGEIYSLFPAACADSYGKKFAAANSGLLYTAKGAASLVVPIGSWISLHYGGWNGVFTAMAIMNAVAAVIAIVVLKPMRAKLVTD